MITVSLCMIVKNEEESLERCLASIADLVEELVIVDTGSTDRTQDIAQQFQARIFSFSWIDDFAAARNYAFEQATQQYIMWLDADDLLLEEDRLKLLSLKEQLDPTVDSVTMLYHLSRDQYGNSTFSLRRNRLVRREAEFRWFGAVHEYLQVGGNIMNSDISIQHMGKTSGRDPERNLRIYEKQLKEGKKLSPRDQYYYANELKDHGKLDQAIHYYLAFLEDGKGWVEDLISACGKLADCYHELQNEQAELESTLRALQYDAPRPDTCCRIGYHFLHKGNYTAAVVWYQLALSIPLPDHFLGFNNPTCSTWLPHVQLSVCYDKLGKYELACQHNELALSYRPTDKMMLANRSYFAARLDQALNASKTIASSDAIPDGQSDQTATNEVAND